MANEATIYTTTTCPICGMVKNFLIDNAIPYKEINVDLNPLAMIKMVTKTGKLTVPQTSIHGEWISGFDPVRILKEISN